MWRRRHRRTGVALSIYQRRLSLPERCRRYNALLYLYSRGATTYHLSNLDINRAAKRWRALNKRRGVRRRDVLEARILRISPPLFLQHRRVVSHLIIPAAARQAFGIFFTKKRTRRNILRTASPPLLYSSPTSHTLYFLGSVAALAVLGCAWLTVRRSAAWTTLSGSDWRRHWRGLLRTTCNVNGRRRAG